MVQLFGLGTLISRRKPYSIILDLLNHHDKKCSLAIPGLGRTRARWQCNQDKFKLRRWQYSPQHAVCWLRSTAFIKTLDWLFRSDPNAVRSWLLWVAGRVCPYNGSPARSPTSACHVGLPQFRPPPRCGRNHFTKLPSICILIPSQYSGADWQLTALQQTGDVVCNGSWPKRQKNGAQDKRH